MTTEPTISAPDSVDNMPGRHLAVSKDDLERLEKAKAHERGLSGFASRLPYPYAPPEPTTPEGQDYVTALRVRRQLNQLKRAAKGAIQNAGEILDNAFPS